MVLYRNEYSKLGLCTVCPWANRDGDMIGNEYRAPGPEVFWFLKKDGRETRRRIERDLNALR